MSDDVGGLVAIWDVRDRNFWRSDLFGPVREWATGQGVPADDTYRVEIHLAGAPFARVFTYAEDERGYRYYDPATGGPAVNEPFVKMLSELPPAGLTRKPQISGS